jgi:hypothetical protein
MEISLQFHRYTVSDKVFMPRRDNGWTVNLKPDGLSSKLAFVTDRWKSFLLFGILLWLGVPSRRCISQLKISVHKMFTTYRHGDKCDLYGKCDLFHPFFLRNYCDLFLSYTTVIEAEGSRFPPDRRWTPQINRCKFFAYQIESAEVSKSSSRL